MNQTNKNIKPDNEAYANCMGEIKARLLLIDRPSVGYLDGIFYLEFMCLQMRKICELFAFATLTANRESYEKVREDFQNDWHYGRILKVVEKENPKYFPEALTPIRDEKSGKITKFKGFAGKGVSFLSKDDIEKIYNECCDFVHAQNHYKDLESFYPRTLEEFQPWKEKLIGWKDEFSKLLNCHVIGVKGKNFITFMYMEDKDKKISVISIKST